ncbi:diguanylate cyclase [Aliikangiella sp. G2MR2-5]|uniref:diguanylate cyclase n=1 Tax=Aliikangiella sp. G2MR2-5 TaxID=2788943 RepID=UPI0018AC374E|nr:diguanylate cyclase [Aliikangiella sp. G2MR2-5]
MNRLVYHWPRAGSAGRQGIRLAHLYGGSTIINSVDYNKQRPDFLDKNSIELFRMQDLNEAGSNILVIEPSRLNREVIEQYIKLSNLTADFVEAPEDAIKNVETNNYQLICCANELNGNKGGLLAKKIREVVGSVLPILLFTSNDSKEVLSEAFNNGVTEVIHRGQLIELEIYLQNIIIENTHKTSERGRVLVVEDSTPVAELIRTVLENANNRVEILDNADLAFERVRLGEPVDIVITDILLEGEKSGIALIRSIRGLDAPLCNLPVLAISGLKNEDQKIEALKQGASDFISKPINFDEMLVRVRNLIRSKRLYERVCEQEQKLRKLAATDPLTGLYNRHYLSEIGIKRVHEACRHGQDLSLVIVDIDYFKRVNDSFGHAAGDSVLKAVGQSLSHECRKEDIAIRFGGEEFVLILPHCDYQSALNKAENLRSMIEELTPEGISITASFGVAYLEKASQEQTFNKLFLRADRAVYRAKEEGRNRVVGEKAVI